MLLTIEVRVNTIVRSKELSQVFCWKIAAAYEFGKGFGKISKEFEVSDSFPKIVYKWRTFKAGLAV